METNKPLISILLAVYDPNLLWLREQLVSLDRQTYPNLRLYVRDDASPTVPFEEIEACVRECVTRFPVIINRNEENVGSNLTFQRLTMEAEGRYFAYCDQDDSWLPEKLSVLEEAITRHHALLVCSDVQVMDGLGEKTADSITRLRPRHRFCSGEDLAGQLLYRNFVIGCTMLISASTAKEACPFVKYMVHDHYLALFASMHGRIYSVPEPLVRYRIHGNNQTGVLHGITTKEDYAQKHLGLFIARIRELSARFSFPELSLAQQWAAAREENWKGRARGSYRLWKLRRVNPSTSYFELIGRRLPPCLFQRAVKRIQRGKI